MYQFSHLYKIIKCQDDHDIKKNTCQKIGIIDTVDMIRKLITGKVPDIVLKVKYATEDGIESEEPTEIAIFILKFKGRKFRFKVFSDTHQTFYVSIREGALFLLSSNYECYGKKGLIVFFEHYFEWGELFGTRHFSHPLNVRYIDIELLQIMNPDYSIKIYKSQRHKIVDGQFEIFQFGDESKYLPSPMIGMFKEGVGEFTVVSVFKYVPSAIINYQHLGFFYVFKSDDERPENKNPVAFCCRGVIGVTDVLKQYPNCALKTDFYRRTRWIRE